VKEKITIQVTLIMVKVQLQNLLFKAFHGIHEEEKLLGNDYSVDASIEFHEREEVIEHIDETIDYAKVYAIIKQRMDVPTPLLETVVMNIGNDIHQKFSDLRSITVSLKKLKPPIEGMQGFAEVTWQRQF
jgi:dihydroneopterin aldolase